MGVRLVMAALVFAFAGPPAAAAQQPPADTAAEQDTREERPSFVEVITVTPGRTPELLVNAPVTVSVITAPTIERSPGSQVGDLLRNVPGTNVVQIGARDINLAVRSAASSLATGQLALVDGRTIYLDFFGLVMWDLVPASLHEIKQIEVIRGPASAVWGANAMNGVINVITKSPRELAADGRSSLVLTAGAFNRVVPGRTAEPGALFSVHGSHAQVVDDRWSYKLSAGYLAQDALPRPAGALPNAFQTPYPAYENIGTTQPKFDVRVDREMTDGARMTMAGGVAGTSGIVHSGIGPFDIAKGTRLSYVTTRYQRGGRRLAVFANLLDGDATNLLARRPTGPISSSVPTATEFLPLAFATRTLDVDASDLRTVGRRHVLTFGGNLRHNRFDISLAPDGRHRTEGGVYLQDYIVLSENVQWVVGGRVDQFSSIDRPVFSPRTTLLVKPAPTQALRASFNRAFRAPSFINNHLATTIMSEVDLSAISPALAQFPFPVEVAGNPDLRQETMTAFEIGYTGIVRDRTLLTAAVYWNRVDDAIFFTQAAAYTPAAPPATWPALLPPAVLGLLPDPGLPARFTYLNLGRVRERGLEMGLETTMSPGLSAFANYSLQGRPAVRGFDPQEVNVPPRNRFNVGVNAESGRLFGNLAVSFTDEAYWQDVLDLRFAGTTEAYTLVNGGVGVRWRGDRLVTSVKATNIANVVVMQHFFGDVIRRQIVGEIRARF